MEKNSKLKSKEWHRDRIRELKFLREDFSFAIKVYLPSLIGLSTIALFVLESYRTRGLWTQFWFAFIVWITMLFALMFARGYAIKNIRPINIKIQNNYDALLRKK